MNTFEIVFLVSITAISAVIDIKERRIPNKIIIPSLVMALAIQLIKMNFESILIAVVILIGLSVLYEVFSPREIIGGGDIKLFTFVALFFGNEVIILVYYWSMYTLVLCGIVYLIGKARKEKMRPPIAVSIFLSVISCLI